MHKLKILIPQSIKNIYHLSQAILANFIYGFPSKKIRVIGITGTNGKTTTVQMIVKILEEDGKKVAMSSTINFQLGGKKWVNKTKYTTLSPFAIQKFIKKAVEKGCEYLILETSSHSLDQFRVWGIKYSSAVITNITREHLDYHGSMEKYRKAKRRLFEIVSRNYGNLIVNMDMEKPEEFLNFSHVKKIGYSTKNIKEIENLEIIEAKNLELGKLETKFVVRDVSFTLYIPGKYNVENALAAISIATSESINLNKASRALSKISGIAGRMDIIPEEQTKGRDVVIDYAVTPDSLDKLYSVISEMKKNDDSRIIAILGSCGERDRGKRPLMGKIVSDYADIIIITNEDPYFENPLQIIKEVASGVENKSENINFWKIEDRREAIRKAFELSVQGDIIVITGKGAEETMAVGNKRIAWSDKKVILEELEILS